MPAPQELAELAGIKQPAPLFEESVASVLNGRCTPDLLSRPFAVGAILLDLVAQEPRLRTDPNVIGLAGKLYSRLDGLVAFLPGHLRNEGERLRDYVKEIWQPFVSSNGSSR